MFPDVARAMQVRRKIFLQLKSEVLAIRGSFDLRFLCKGLVRYQGNSYTFLPLLRAKLLFLMKLLPGNVSLCHSAGYVGGLNN